MNIFGREDVAARAATLVCLHGSPSRRSNGDIRVFTTWAGAVMIRKKSFLHLELCLGCAEDNMEFLVWHLAGDAGPHQSIFNDIVERAVRSMAPNLWRKMDEQPSTTFYLHREVKGAKVSDSGDYTELLYPQVLDPVYLLWLLNEAESVLCGAKESSYNPLTENCQHFVMRRVTPARLKRLQEALASRNAESSLLASAGSAVGAIGCVNPAAGLVAGIGAAAVNLFISLVRDTEICDTATLYTDRAERDTQNEFFEAQQSVMASMRSSRSR